MKKTILGSAIMAMVALAMASFTYESGLLSPKRDQKNSYDTCYNCDNDRFFGLTPEEFALGVKKYKKTHLQANKDYLEAATAPGSVGTAQMQWRRNNMTTDKGPARMCWFSLDSLKKFICLIEKAAANDHIPLNELGIDFAYAVYPRSRKVKIDGTDYEYKNLHTLFMVPTRYIRGEGSQAIAINPTLKGHEILREQLASQSATNKTQKMLVLNPGFAAVDSQNQGQLCPPTCQNAMTTLIQAVDNYPGDW